MSKSSFGEVYLKGYNVLQILGWSSIYFMFFGIAMDHFLVHPTDLPLGPHVFALTRFPLTFFQFLMILDVLNAAVGLVRASPLTCAIQVTSRLLVVVALLADPVVSAESIGISLIHAAWCPAEVIRYAYYFIKGNPQAHVPSWLLWLRYSAFVVLYPTGITGEILLLRKAQVAAQDHGLLWVVYAIWAIFVIYIPGAIFLFAHMFKLRRKSLRAQNDDKKKK